MKKLLYKELNLVFLPLVYIFLLLDFILFIPNYLYTISMFYICLGIFFCFLKSRENNDVLYMITLPIRKSDIVEARYLLVLFIELLQIIICIPIVIIRCTILNYPNIAGIDVNVAFLGLAFIQLAIFNRVFLGLYFKDVNQVGKAFLIACVIEFLVISIIEASVHISIIITGTCFWDSYSGDDLVKQIPFLIVGILIYAISMKISYQKDVKNFIKLDLL